MRLLVRTRAVLVGAALLMTAVLLASGGSVVAATSEVVDASGGWRLFTFPTRRHDANARLFPKWNDMRQRTRAAGPDGPPCEGDGVYACHYQTLRGIAEQARALPAARRLQFVHEFVNRLSYIPDTDLYGVSDYWATQFQFYASDGGDCEDYSISKYFALKLLGFDSADMRVVILRDTNLRADHAVLVVMSDGVQWVLDNNLDTIVDARRIYHLLPYYALNEAHWWSFQGVPLERN